MAKQNPLVFGAFLCGFAILIFLQLLRRKLVWHERYVLIALGILFLVLGVLIPHALWNR